MTDHFFLVGFLPFSVNRNLIVLDCSFLALNPGLCREASDRNIVENFGLLIQGHPQDTEE